ncbi:phage host specificity protein [Escherichia coli]|nr:phage host specificity protein [Escherichia coli]
MATYGVWGLSLPSLRRRLFRCVSIRENTDGTFAITAVQHVPEKEAIVDNGARFEPMSGSLNSVIPPAVQHLTVEVSASDGQYLALAKWDTPRVVKGVRFSLRLTSGNGENSRLVTSAITADTEHRFSGLPLGEYTLTVRAINSYGQQGEPATTTFRINAPAAPASIELTPGYFQITVVPHPAVYDPTVQHEFWFSEKRITDTAQVETSARYLGTGSQWSVSGPHIKPGKDFWFYVRSVNLVGKSAFVEASGQASNDGEGYLEIFRGLIDEALLGQALKERIDASALRTEVTQLEEDIRQRLETDVAEVTRKIGEAENSLTQLVAKKNEDQTLAIAQVSQQVDRVSSEITQTVSQSTEENARQIAQVRQYVDDKGSEITSTTDKKLEDQSATIQQIQQVQSDTNDELAALYMLKVQKTKNGIPYVAGIGAGIEDADGQPLSNILLQADRIAMINPENGNTTPLFVAQGNQLFMNDVFLKRLFAVSITSSGNPPTFSLTPEGRLTARNADISGHISANSGTLNNVTIAENCVVKGTVDAGNILGDVYYRSMFEINKVVFSGVSSRDGVKERDNEWIPFLNVDGENFDRFFDVNMKIAFRAEGNPGLVSAWWEVSVGTDSADGGIATVWSSGEWGPGNLKHKVWENYDWIYRFTLPAKGRGNRNRIYVRYRYVRAFHNTLNYNCRVTISVLCNGGTLFRAGNEKVHVL